MTPASIPALTPDPACQWSPDLGRLAAADEPQCGMTVTLLMLRRRRHIHRMSMIGQAYVCTKHLHAARLIYPSRYFEMVVP